METPPSSTLGAINLGAAAFRDGRLADARGLFVRALELDQDSEVAWLWLATVVDDPAEQRYCLNRALAINPESAALRRLALLPPGPAKPPPDLALLDEPPLPPDLAAPASTPSPLLPRPMLERRHRASANRARPEAKGVAPQASRRRGLLRIASGLLAIVAVALAVFALMRPDDLDLAGDAYVIAFAGPLSGPDAYVGVEQQRAVELAVAAVNAAGGIAGRPVELLSFDDQNDPALVAEVANTIAADDRVQMVIGHHTSTSSTIAAPIYREAGLPAITPSASVDALTADDDWYFRTVLPNQAEGAFVAAYAEQALRFNRSSVIATEGLYEDSLASAYAAVFGNESTVVARWNIDPGDRESSIATIVAELMATDDPGIVMLALGPRDAHDLLLALRRAGSTVPVLGGNALGYEAFGEGFATEPEELEQPGFFTNGMNVVSNLLVDGRGGSALAFAQQYDHRYGENPEWFGAKAHDAATLALHALGTVAADDVATGIADQRRHVRDALAAINSLEVALPGVSGLLYFDETRSVPQVVSFGVFDRGFLLNAPVQYRAVTHPEKFDLEADQAAGLLYRLNDQLYRQYRVVYVGVDVNEVSNLNARDKSYDVDFYLWLRYTGDDRVENVFFPNATDTSLRLDDPLDRAEDNGLHFVIHRVNATFTEPMDFQNYPWDQHVLVVSLQNETLTSNDVVYVPDPVNLHQTQAERLLSGSDTTRPFNRVPTWNVEWVDFVQGSAQARSTKPNPRTGAPEFENMSTYQVQMTYARDVRSFLIKNLLPLGLLALVTYISLYFPAANASTRIGFSITSILTSSVMLQAISNNLPEIGYTVAIEWGYYVYIALSAVLVLLNIMVDRRYKQKRYVAVQHLDLIARVLYPTVLAITILVYAIHFW